MFIEKIDEQLLNEIRDEMEEEYSQLVASWDEEYVDMEYDDFEDVLRSEIFGHYHHIPFYKLENLISEHFPFIKEKDIAIDPFSKIVFLENDGYEVVEVKVYADTYASEKEKLTETELKELDILLKELTHLYYEELDVETELTITHIPIKDVPKEYYHGNAIELECDFIQIRF